MKVSYSDKDRKSKIQEALTLRYDARKNWADIADEIEIARSTLNEWRKLDEWKEADAKWRRMLRDDARGDSSQMLPEAIDTLYELMKTDKSGYVRYMAACKIADMNQVGQEIEERVVDQSKELQDFLMRAAQRPAITNILVQPGGLLPTEIQEQNEAYKQRKLAEAASLEAEFKALAPSEETQG